ncbi:hypothetical protein B0H10DRAFT_637007 [Mycena sp. CBHHK59/15]|nr:hypothetical protein B0H10DRAFT_637007 [Mycena sp. CBHHK59/15]
MASNSSPPPKRVNLRTKTRQLSPPPSPAEAVAQAWARKSAEEQANWRVRDQSVRAQYEAGRKTDSRSKL